MPRFAIASRIVLILAACFSVDLRRRCGADDGEDGCFELFGEFRPSRDHAGQFRTEIDCYLYVITRIRLIIWAKLRGSNPPLSASFHKEIPIQAHKRQSRCLSSTGTSGRCLG